MARYTSSSYQQEIIDELSRQSFLITYGPGYKGYRLEDNIDDILAKQPTRPDYIWLGHSWLLDGHEGDVDPHPRLKLASTKIPKVAFLNKEYVNLESKLEYYQKNRCDLVFTHHHESSWYSSKTGIPFIFLPFGFDSRKYYCNQSKPTIDMMFSGMLQNQNPLADQSNIRVRIMNKLFHTVNDYPIVKRKAFKNRSILWNSIPRKHRAISHRIISRLPIFFKHKYLSGLEYAEHLRATKLSLNTLSPKGLISPRVFESMASGAVVLCECSDHYKRLFPSDCFICFQSDLTNLIECVDWFLDHEIERKKIADKAIKFVTENHSWEIRVQKMLAQF